MPPLLDLAVGWLFIGEDFHLSKGYVAVLHISFNILVV